jgi:two-component system, NarL family, invasion response regulator UvrY
LTTNHLRSFLSDHSAKATDGADDVKILIVDDHLAVREGARCLFAAMPGAEIFEAASAEEALSVYRSKVPDVLLMDLNLPDSRGIDLLSNVLIEDRLAKIVVFSAHEEPIYVSRTFTAGALGYVSKGASAKEIIDAVQTVAAGGAM